MPAILNILSKFIVSNQQQRSAEVKEDELRTFCPPYLGLHFFPVLIVRTISTLSLLSIATTHRGGEGGRANLPFTSAKLREVKAARVGFIFQHATHCGGASAEVKDELRASLASTSARLTSIPPAFGAYHPRDPPLYVLQQRIGEVKENELRASLSSTSAKLEEVKAAEAEQARLLAEEERKLGRLQHEANVKVRPQLTTLLSLKRSLPPSNAASSKQRAAWPKKRARWPACGRFQGALCKGMHSTDRAG